MVIKRFCFGIPVDLRAKIKEKEKIDKYLEFARELTPPKKKQTNKLWNIRVKVIPNVVGALGTVLRNQVKRVKILEIIGRIETPQTTALLRSARILRRVLEI